MPVVAVCPTHGPFPSRMFKMTSSVGTFVNCMEHCPDCGALSDVMDGTYSFDVDGIASALSAPTWSRFALRQVQADIQQMANAAQDPTVSDAQLDQIAESVAERLGSRDERLADLIVEQVRGKPRHAVVVFLVGLAAVLGMLDGAVSGGKLIHDVVLEVVTDVLG